MSYYISSGIISDEGLVMPKLPFKKGAHVRVVIMEEHQTNAETSKRIRGSVVSYDNPLDPPLNDGDWEIYS